jgi:hypothetical protein
MATDAADRRERGSLDAVGLALRLTLLDLLLHPIGDWWLRPFLLALAAVALVVPTWLRSPRVWMALAILTGVRVLAGWPLPDNHAYLLCYWCLAISLCLRLGDPRPALAWNGRWLIGLVFAFAIVWKLVLSPDYRDGTFFQVMLVNDPRFEGLSRLLGGMTPELLERARLALTQHVDIPLQAVELPQLPSRLVGLADFATFGTGLLEAAIALAFLWPSRGLPARARNPLLLLFCATTYAAAPVEGFGWLLIAMGVAQCEPEQPGARALYLGAYVLVLFYREVPWALLLAESLAS